MAVKTIYRVVTKEAWRKEGIELFGEDVSKWKFVCPACGVVTLFEEWVDKWLKQKFGISKIEAIEIIDEMNDSWYYLNAVYEAAARNMIAFSCIGRTMGKVNDAFTNKQPCNYAGGGLIRLNPVTVVGEDGTEHHAFDFYREGK